MSRLEELLQTLCPDGVEYKKLGQVCTFIKGKGLSKNAKWLGDIPIILYGELYTTYGNYITEVFSHTSEDLISSSPIIHKGDLLLPVSSTTKEAQIGKASVYMVDKPAYLGSDAILLRHKQNPSFLMYLLNGNLFEKSKMKCVFGTTINHLHPSKLSNIYIPVPPLLVQEEIVRILDTFTALENELEAELAARTKQYVHYRNELLSFDSKSKIVNEYKLVKIKDIARRNHGTNITANRMKVLHKDNGPVRVFAGGSTFADIDYSDIPKKDIIRDTSIIIKSRGYIGFEYYEKPFSHKNEFWSYTFSKECNTKYIYYFLLTKTDYFQQKARASSVKLPQLSVSDTDNFLVPLPSLEIQEKIVSILDRFTTLVNDLKSGLPAEIALRRKQYEYYRDKLLTFQPLE